MLYLRDSRALCLYQGSAFGPCFAHVAALQVARKNHPGVLVQDLARVHVPERPVVVTFVDERCERAGRVAGVTRAAVDRGMQQAKIEPIGLWRRVTRYQIALDGGARV